ncbi:MAG: YraN family protein [Actinomycetota bacterium]|nr:YraN family protein [Actinomycetota bacterium]
MGRDEVWHGGEEAAWEVYRRRGYRLLARNWRCPMGELDLVLEKGGRVVFCEVKARTTSRLGQPYEAVTPAKQRKLRALAEVFGDRRPQPPLGYRFDVASVSLGRNGARVNVFEDAF